MKSLLLIARLIIGGLDPYSASKAALEIAVKSWRNSFSRSSAGNGKLIGPIATVRSGNVIGGSDYAQNRIIPDLVRATVNSEELAIRNPKYKAMDSCARS